MTYKSRSFIMSAPFDEAWLRLGLSDKDLLDLQERLSDDPQVGQVIPGTGGLRKLRISLSGKGKRGGARVVYVDFVIVETIYLFYVYGKNEQENLTETDKKDYKVLIAKLESTLVQKKE